MMTIQQAWSLGIDRLQASVSARLDARMLLEHALGKPHTYLVAHGERPLSASEERRYLGYLDRAAAYEPVPYITGSAPFLDFELRVTPEVLIPRPETEQLAELAIAWARDRGPLTVVDVGTGTGCLAIALARQTPRARIAAVDTSAAALKVAEYNVRRLAPGRVSLVQGDLLSSFGAGLDLIVANLPYVSESEWTSLADGVKFFEPSLALLGGPDGLDPVRAFLPQAAAALRRGGLLLAEIGWRQGRAAQELALAAFPASQVDMIKDFAGHDRYVKVQN